MNENENQGKAFIFPKLEPIEGIPSISPQREGLSIRKKLEVLPEHDLNWDEFVYYYYEIVMQVYRFHHQARQEDLPCFGLEELEDFRDDDIFKMGLRLVDEGTDGESIRSLLLVLLEREYDPYKITLRRVQMEGILGIHGREHWPRLVTRLNTFVDIPGNQISILIGEYYKTGNAEVFNILGKPGGVHYDLPPEREEVRFIKRAFSLTGKAQREGLLALEEDRDLALFDREDVLECGLPLVIDGEEPERIGQLLDLLIEREHDPWKKRLARAKKEAVLSLQAGDNPRILVNKLLAYFNKYVGELVEREIGG